MPTHHQYPPPAPFVTGFKWRNQPHSLYRVPGHQLPSFRPACGFMGTRRPGLGVGKKESVIEVFDVPGL